MDSSPEESKDDIQKFCVKAKGQRDDETLDSFQLSQADWIRRYMEQQEEVCSRTASGVVCSIILSGDFCMYFQILTAHILECHTQSD